MSEHFSRIFVVDRKDCHYHESIHRREIIRKILSILLITLCFMMLAACAPASTGLPDDGPAGTEPVNPNRIKAGEVFHTFSIDQRPNYKTEGKVFVHIIKPETTSGAKLIVYTTDQNEQYLSSVTFLISATANSVEIECLEGGTPITLSYDETGEAEIVIDAAASTKGTFSVTVCNYPEKNQKILHDSTLPESAARVKMGFDKLSEDVPFSTMEVFTSSLTHITDR